MAKLSAFSSLRSDLEHVARQMEMIDLDEHLPAIERWERLQESSEELAELLERVRSAI